MKINLHCLSFLSFIPKIHKIPTYHWSKTIENGGKSHCVRNTSLVHVGHNYWHPIIATSFSQHNSSEFSPIMPEEFGEHLIRDQRPFSSSRISPDPSDSQLHDGASSLQFTSLIFYRFRSEDGNGHSRSLVCAQWPIFVLFLRFVFGLLSGWKIQTRPIIRFLTGSVTYWFLSVGIW